MLSQNLFCVCEAYKMLLFFTENQFSEIYFSKLTEMKIDVIILVKNISVKYKSVKEVAKCFLVGKKS